MRLLTATFALALTLSAGADNEFLSTWKAPGASPMDFTGRRVVAMLISDDTSLRVYTFTWRAEAWALTAERLFARGREPLAS